MDEKVKNDIALFRYGVLAPLIQRQVDEAHPWAYFRRVQNKKFEYVDGTSRTVTAVTMDRWYKAYREKGFDGLKPQNRSDVGSHRKLDDEVKEIIRFYIDAYPRLPAAQIYDKLLTNGDITRRTVSPATVNRFVRKYKDSKNILPVTELRRYEKENINEVWYGDTTYASYITIGGKKVRVYVIALIDDASRMIVGCGAFLEDNSINLMKILRSAMSKYGKPKLLSFDNGSNYRSRQMTLLGARIGVSIHYCPPYTPTSKSKIERFFRTLKDQYLCMIRPGDYHDLETYDRDLQKWIQEYNTRPHSSLEGGKTPTERFFEQGDQIIEMNPDMIERSFLLEVQRRVSADGVISIDGKQYEVDYHHQNRHVWIRYAPDFSQVYLVDMADGSLSSIQPVDKISNGHKKREKIRLSEVGEV